MHAAQVEQWGQLPRYVELPTPELPAFDSNTVQVKLLAAGLHRVVRSRASGRHYSAKSLPHTPGVDGVGVTTTGQRVYLSAFQSGGSFAEVLNVAKKDLLPLPDGLDPVQAAGMSNLAMSSWMALKLRCENLPEGFSVLIMGATSASGRAAITFARHLGAKRIVGVARSEETLKRLGLDEIIVLKENTTETDYSKLGHVDVVLDYLCGPLATHLLQTLKPEGRVQYVHIGGLAGTELVVPGDVLRSNDIVIRGSGAGSFSMKALWGEMRGLLQALVGAEEHKFRVEKLEDVEKVWLQDGGDRIVFVP